MGKIMHIGEMTPSEEMDDNQTLVRARAELGVTAFGLNSLFLKPRSGSSGFNRHNHADEGLEEVYIVMQGSGEVQFGDGDWQVIQAGSFIYADPEDDRAFRTNNELGLLLCAIAGARGKQYSPPAWTELPVESGESETGSADMKSEQTTGTEGSGSEKETSEQETQKAS